MLHGNGIISAYPEQAAIEMSNLSRWVTQKSKREILTFLGTGIAALIAALWAVTTHWEHTESTKIEATFKVCRGMESMCPPGAQVLGCYANIADWAGKQCKRFTQALVQAHSGGKCGVEVFEIKCTAESH